MNERTLASTERFAELAQRLGMSPVTFAVAWMLTQRLRRLDASSASPRRSSSRSILAAADAKLPPEALAAVDQISKEIRYPME